MLILSFVFFAGCSSHGDSHNVLLKIEDSEATSSDAYSNLAPSVEGPLLISVTRVANPFSVIARTGQITKFPCVNCHNKPLSQMTSTDSLGRKAHWNLHLQHAPEPIMNCGVCHNEGDLNTLRTITGVQVTFNESYQLCQQCHSRQYTDWQGGAHGKRVGGWTPPRVIKLCVECHDPHQPRWDKRWPAQPSLTMKRLIR
ncbi:cytochrome C [bacterium]|nr:cytochrome C [bacterium]